MTTTTNEKIQQAQKMLGKSPLNLEYLNAADFTSQEYMNFCKKAINEDREAFEYIDKNYLTKEQYREICNYLFIDFNNSKVTNKIYLKFIDENLIEDKQFYVKCCLKACQEYYGNLKYVNTELLSPEQYLECCDNALLNGKKNCYASYIDTLELIKPDKFPIEKKGQEYLDIVKSYIDYIKDKNYYFVNLKGIKPEFLPKKASVLYANICKKAITAEPQELVFVKPQYFPKTQQETLYIEFIRKSIEEKEFGFLTTLKDNLVILDLEKQYYLEILQKSLQEIKENKYHFHNYYYNSNTTNFLQTFDINFFPTSFDKQQAQQLYLDFCQAFLTNSYMYFSSINCENLPEQNREQIYLDLFKKIKSNYDLSIEKHIAENQKYLPIDFQNLNVKQLTEKLNNLENPNLDDNKNFEI